MGYLQLARKVRDPKTGVPKDEILYHFGREDELDRDQLRRLIQSLSRFLPAEDQVQFQAQMAGAGVDEDLRLVWTVDSPERSSAWPPSLDANSSVKIRPSHSSLSPTMSSVNY